MRLLALFHIVKEDFLCEWLGKFLFDVIYKDDVENLASMEGYPGCVY